MKSAQIQLSCDESESLMRPYLEGEVPPEQAQQLDQHVTQCTACTAQLSARQQVHSLLQKAYQPRRLTSMFDEVTTRKLQERGRASGDHPRDIAPANVGHDEDDFYDEEDENDQVAAAPTGFINQLSSSFGAAPWWMVSGAFHALLLILVTLISLALFQSEKEDTVIVTELQKAEPPEEIEKPERTIVPQPEPIEPSEIVTEETPIVTHTEVEIADQVETPDDSDAQDSNGEDGMGEAFLGGSGSVAAMGLGGGGRSGAFGRPGGAGGRMRRATAGGGGKKTESAVEKALEWLARHQEADGHWDTKKYEAKGNKWCDTAVTGFSVLAFLGAGHTEKIGKYKDNVQRGVKWLIAKQKANGILPPSGKEGNLGYTNAIAGMALAEAAAMARVPATLQAAQKAVTYGGEIHQRGEGSEKRGYRYKAKMEGDLSNTGWFIMQLKSAKVAGLQIPHGSFEGVAWFLDHVEDKNFKKVANSDYDTGAHRYGYTDNKSVTHVRTAIGCLARQFMGTPANELQGGVEWFVEEGGIPGGGGAGSLNLYYWYYGTLCTFQQGGDVWKKWNVGLKATLLPSQRKDGDMDGSWDPKGPWSSHWGRVGQTALSALCLEVYYRYLPMFQK